MISIKEAEIRPENTKQGQSEAYASDVRWLLQHLDEFVAVDCPACDTSSSTFASEKYGLRYVVCSNCDTMYVNPRPSPSLLERYYSRSENYTYWNRYIFPASEEARREKIFRPRVERLAQICRRHGIATGVLVEVGGGFGTFCEEVRRVGLFRRVIAVEPTPDLAESCRHRGIEVIDKPIEQVSLEGERVDVIACFEVIEHLFSPREFLNGCSSLLSPGGCIILTCPNVHGFDIATLGALSDSVDTEHLNYFHPASLSRLVEECGLQLLEVTTPGKLDAELVRKKALAGEYDLSSQPFLKRLLIDEWERAGDAFQQFLSSNNLSSHMWLVAQKPVDATQISKYR